ncbi:hypothetical protein EYF80_018507 [Liparis tanakae]|uniref:Uncharacterized protein n=1 Tax=Liparis tanakae TaxID=230148 RepID=A0A4Z2I1A7_9TELE|nr:hypothetical protein EYF80_018507 [Liparis tanakae]
MLPGAANGLSLTANQLEEAILRWSQGSSCDTMQPSADDQVAACVFEAYDFPYHPQSGASSRTSNAPSVLQTLRSPLSRGSEHLAQSFIFRSEGKTNIKSEKKRREQWVSIVFVRAINTGTDLHLGCKQLLGSGLDSCSLTCHHPAD